MKIQYLNGMNVSASGLAAQRRQMDVAAENLANAYTTKTETGDPYRRQQVSFRAVLAGPETPGPKVPRPPVAEPAPLATTHRVHSDRVPILPRPDGVSREPLGVRAEVAEDPSEFLTVHDPTHPDADENGNVRLPNVDLAQEMVSLMIAARAYEANVAALGAAETIANAALDLAR